MTGAWEDPIRVAELVESVNLQNIQSGVSTLISGAESGESVHVFEIVVEKENAMSGATVWVFEVDGSGTSITLDVIDFQESSGITSVNRVPIGTGDPMKPWKTLENDARIEVRTNFSGGANVTARFWRDKT